MNARSRHGCRRAAALAGGLLLSGGTSSAVGAVTLPTGTPIELVLQHHVTSAYVPVGAPVYFRVGRDVQADGRILVAAGTLVQGQMAAATDRGMVGRSGTMTLGVHVVPAVDGTSVAVDADLNRQGRSRTGATVGWTLFWGLPGLITKGVNPYLERGATIEAMTIAPAIVDPDKAIIAAEPSVHAPPLRIQIDGHSYEFETREPFAFDIERNRDLKVMNFGAFTPPGTSNPAGVLAAIKLVAVDGVPVPVPVPVASSTADSMTFDTWSILQFCHDGTSDLRFSATAPDGWVYVADYRLTIKVRKKVPQPNKGGNPAADTHAVAN